MIDLDKLKEKAKANKKQYKKLFTRLSKKRNGEVDQIIHQAHDEVFECTDCLKCANCCKTTGPLFTDKDIERISKHLNLHPSEFISKYLRIDEDNDHVLQSTPCSFLDEDNYCSIYEVRPKACREYPHTDRNKQLQITRLTMKNAEICPAVFEILEKLKGIN